MAELATIARPYAEAFFKVVGAHDAAASAAQLDAIAAVAVDPQLRQLADSPKSTVTQVYELIAGVVNTPLSPPTNGQSRCRAHGWPAGPAP